MTSLQARMRGLRSPPSLAARSEAARQRPGYGQGSVQTSLQKSFVLCDSRDLAQEGNVMNRRRDLLLSSGATFALASSPAGFALAHGAPQKGGVLRMILNVEPPSLLSAINSSLWIACMSTKC